MQADHQSSALLPALDFCVARVTALRRRGLGPEARMSLMVAGAGLRLNLTKQIVAISCGRNAGYCVCRSTISWRMCGGSDRLSCLGISGGGAGGSREAIPA